MNWWPRREKPLRTECGARTSDGLTAGILRSSDDYLLVTYQIEGSVYVHTKATAADPRAAEPQVAVFVTLTKVTLGDDTDTDG